MKLEKKLIDELEDLQRIQKNHNHIADFSQVFTMCQVDIMNRYKIQSTRQFGIYYEMVCRGVYDTNEYMNCSQQLEIITPIDYVAVLGEN